jgi:translation initiation factor 2 gamma subunit (eIF-2gamma)
MSRKEAKERIEKIKKLLKDYIELAPVIEIDEKTQKQTVDMFLDDLSKALKESEK